MTLDHLDAAILYDLAWHPADPLHATRGQRRPWDIARNLGLHGTTVKRRLADLRAKGVVRGVHVQPSASLVGLRSSKHILTFPDAPSRRRAFEAVKAHPQIWKAYGLVGDQILATLATPEHEDVQEAASRFGREVGATAVRYHHVEWEVPADRISALDLRILAAFAEDALRPIREAAAEIGVQSRTITTRMRALAAAKAFLVHPYLDYTRMEGGMTMWFDVTLAVGHDDTPHVEIANRFPLALCRSPRGMDNAFLVTHVNGANELDDVLVRAQAIPSALRVESRVMHEVFHEPARWKDALLRRAEELARARGIWSPSWRAKPQPAG